MKKLLLLCAALFITAAMYAQAVPLTVKNGTNCAFWVYGYASPGGCGLTCVSGPVCCLPGVATIIPPCGPGTWVWDVARVVPANNTCTAPCPGPSTGVSPPGGFCPFPAVAGGTHCICGPFVADFSVAPNVVYIL